MLRRTIRMPDTRGQRVSSPPLVSNRRQSHADILGRSVYASKSYQWEIPHGPLERKLLHPPREARASPNFTRTRHAERPEPAGARSIRHPRPRNAGPRSRRPTPRRTCGRREFPSPRPARRSGESSSRRIISIEGKIEGTGNVKIAGRFKGDVRIDGNFTIEQARN